MAQKIVFDLNSVIDINAGIQQVGGEDLFFSMMENFEDMSLIKNLTNLKEFYESRDNKQFREEAHALKGAAGYLAAGKVSDITAKIQTAYFNSNYDEEFSYYPALLEEAIILRIEIKKLISQRKSIMLSRHSIRGDY